MLGEFIWMSQVGWDDLVEFVRVNLVGLVGLGDLGWMGWAR